MELIQIDAFTSKPFAGNPAAVCWLEAFPTAVSMQNLAREMNLSETAFLRPLDGELELRWFTPTVEVDLCGHATLASAHFLWESGRLVPGATARFSTRSGELTAWRNGDWIEMDFPSQPPGPTSAPSALREALGAEPLWVGRNDADWLIELDAASTVRELVPDLARLATIDGRGFIVTAVSDSPDADFVSRFFAPGVGVDEDPVTGSAHCCLGPFWAARLGREELVGFQASARGGHIRVVPRGDRVILAGQAVTVLRVELTIPWP